MNWTLFPIDEVWAAEAPPELVGEIAPIDLYASDHMDARITIEAPDNTRGAAEVSSADRRALMKNAAGAVLPADDGRRDPVGRLPVPDQRATPRRRACR